jgi:GAF domain-containing protein
MTDTYLTTLVRIACEVADGNAASLFLVDGPVLRPYIVYNLPEAYVAGIGTVRIGTQCCGRAVEHAKPWIVTDMLNDPLFADGRAGAAASPIKAAFSVPVFSRENTVIGSLACHFAAPHTPTRTDIERNEAFARLVTIALHGRAPYPFEKPICAFPPAA